MTRNILVFLFGSFALLGNSQIWCPPGATWTYTHTNNWTHEGYAQYAYVGDTMITGLAAQKITMHAEGYDWSQQTTFSWDFGPYYTSVSGGLVSLWTGTAFDTLYNFNANVGDHWQMNIPDGGWTTSTLTVSDTGTMLVDAIPLHFLVVDIDGWSSDTIVERLGTLGQQLVPWASQVTDALNGPLRCYTDVDIELHQPSWSFGCTSVTSVGEQDTNDQGPCILPNPGTDHFTLFLSPGVHVVTLFDARGRQVVEQRTSGRQAVIVTEQLPSGIYAVQIDAGRTPIRWVKQ